MFLHKGGFVKRIIQIIPLAIAIGLLTTSIAAISGDSTRPVIPNGHIDGRSDAKYGTYGSPMQDSARPYQDRLITLQNQAYGLAQLSGEQPVRQSELVFLLENEILGLHQDISNAPDGTLTPFERSSLLYGTVRAYQDARHHAERLYENMIRYIDLKIPGPNGQQIREEAEHGSEPLYSPNYRSDQDLTDKQREALYQKRLQDFQAEGGSMNEIQVLNAQALSAMPEYSRFEYVWMKNGEVRITAGKAGHILLANGKQVQAAGQMVFLRNHAGVFTMAIISNASGSYKPDLLSAEQVTTKIIQLLNIPDSMVLVTKGEPVSTQSVKIYMKADSVDPAVMKKRIKELESRGRELLSPKMSEPGCGGAFSAA
jgi:hypothetical protein